MKRQALLFLTIIMTPAFAMAETAIAPAERVVEHHMQAGNNRNLEAMLSDYAADAILVSPDGVVKGKQAIRSAFAKMMTQEPYPVITPDKKIYEGNVGYIVWTANAGQANELHGSDTFILRDGKIVVQTVATFPSNQK